MDEAEESTKKLEKIYGMPVFCIVYNPKMEEGIKEGDEICLGCAIEQELKKGALNKCMILLSGSGGDFKTALLMSYLIRKKFDYYSCLVPSVAGSSLCYIILHSNKLLMGKNSLLTQIDPKFDVEGESYRAIKQLDNPNPNIRNKSHDIFHYVFGELNNLLSHKYSLLKSRKVEIGDISPIIYLFMGKEYHEDGVRLEEIKKLNVNINLVEEDVIEVSKKLVNMCWEKLLEDNKRLIVQTKNGSYVPLFD